MRKSVSLLLLIYYISHNGLLISTQYGFFTYSLVFLCAQLPAHRCRTVWVEVFWTQVGIDEMHEQCRIHRTRSRLVSFLSVQ